MNPTLKNQIPPVAVRKAAFAAAIGLSTRSVDRYLAAGILPQIKLPSPVGKDGKSHGSVLIPLDDALAALNRFRLDALGEVTQPDPRPAKRRAGRMAAPTVRDAR